MNVISRLVAFHAALWSRDKVYRLSWRVSPAAAALLICGWVSFGNQHGATSSAAPWGKPATSAKVPRGNGVPDLSIWPATLRDDVRQCTNGDRDWSSGIEACSRLIGSGLLNDWQMVLIYNQRGGQLGSTQPNRALADFDAALKIRPKTPESYANRATIYISRGQADLAVADLSKAIDLWIPELAAPTRVLRARAYFMLKQYDKATADLDESAKVDTDNPDLYLWRANVDFAEHRDLAAASNFEQYAKRLPHDPVGFIGRGMALEAASRFDEALLSYEAALKLDPSDSRAISGRDRIKACGPTGCPAKPKWGGWMDSVGPR